MAQFPTVIKCLLQVVPLLSAAAVLSACSSTPAETLQNTKTENRTIHRSDGLLLQTSQNKLNAILHHADIKSKILQQYANWKGVRYSMGGNSKRGVDCSAFVQLTFREQFDMYLPRSTWKQQDVGKKIQRVKLRAGDLVLFQAGPTGRHIGISLGDDQFVHASTHRGVIVSSLKEGYWNKRFYTARRVLNNKTFNIDS